MRWRNNRGICMVIRANDLFSMMIIRVCAATDTPMGSKKGRSSSCYCITFSFLLLQWVNGCYFPHVVSHHSHQELRIAISIIFLQKLCEWYGQFPQRSPLGLCFSVRLALLAWKMLIGFYLRWEPGHLGYLICFPEQDSGNIIIITV